MNKIKILQQNKIRRKKRVRAKISGTKLIPRLSVFRSNKSMYVQIINDKDGKTIISAHSNEIKKKSKKTEISFELGKIIAKKALEKNIEKIIFDRSSYKYHGRVKALAEGAREGGLKF